ncbi:MAG: carboxypeptidase-like regulatory domain-containing protein [Planctomycetaceae bacterium]|jgi:hypothetical protein|nr:carboxypeptidase-like regulatory domain-containing protein [Planctomycetaceae bacterium]
MKLWMLFPMIVTLTLLVDTAGCGKGGSSLPTQYVEGIVTLDGAPVEQALITFTPADKENGTAATGYSDASGKYTLTSVGGGPQKGAVAGDYRVTVSKVSIKMVKTPPQYPGEEPSESAVQTQLLPQVYLKAEKSPLRVSVVKGRNSINLPLTKEGK